MPPLGLCLLSSVLQKDYVVEIYDCMFAGDNEKLLAKLEEFNPDYVGVSLRNIDDMKILDTAYFPDRVKSGVIDVIKRYKKVPLILGGSGFSIYPIEIMELFDGDYGIVGEGEHSLPALLKALDENGDPSGIPGVILRGQKSFKRSWNNNRLLEIPKSEIDKKLSFVDYKERGAYSIQTKRGCAHECIYCSYGTIEGVSFRARTPESIADEIEEVYHRLGTTMFEFVDSTFNDPAGHAEAICRAIIKKKVKVNLRTMGINPVNVTTELFDLMKEAGFAQMDCTPDSASPTMIKNMMKNFTIEQLERAARLIKEYDMPTMWFFIFGGPGENEKTVAETFSFIDNYVNQYDMVHMTVGLRIYPETKLHEIAVNEGYLSADHNLLKPVFYVSKELGQEKLYSLISKAASTRPNCIPADESTPPPEMIKVAVDMRKKFNLDEPLFRTMLRLRYRMMERNSKI